MAAREQVHIVNGDIHGFCLPSALGAWESNGWTVVDDGSSETGSPEPGELVTEDLHWEVSPAADDEKE
jgi:hypothetical protein